MKGKRKQREVSAARKNGSYFCTITIQILRFGSHQLAASTKGLITKGAQTLVQLSWTTVRAISIAIQYINSMLIFQN